MERDRPLAFHSERRRHFLREGGRPHLALRRLGTHHPGVTVQVLVRHGDHEAQGPRRARIAMTDYREADRSQLKTVSVARRAHRVGAGQLAHPPGADASFGAFWPALPAVLAANDLRYVADQMVRAVGRRGVLVMFGGHVVKVGLGPLLIELMRRRVITAVAMNG